MAIVAVEDVERALRRGLSPSEREEAEGLIADYQEEMEHHLGRAVEARESTESGRARDGRLYVTRGPVRSVSALSTDGVAQAVGTFGRDYVDASAYDGQAVSATYVGGWDAERARPAKRAILARVCRTLNRGRDDAHGVKRVSTEGETVEYEPEGFFEAELRACSRLKNWPAAAL